MTTFLHQLFIKVQSWIKINKDSKDFETHSCVFLKTKTKIKIL